MKFSLLIATLNRPKQLRSCINSILQQTFVDYEIIIVDQSEGDYIDRTISEISEKISYIHISEKGLSHARNIGIKAAKGDYICLMDDDGTYENNVLEIASKVIDEKKPTVLGGKLIDPVTEKAKTDANECFVGWKNVFNLIISSTMIIERDFLKKILFDERFGVGAKYGSGEESDIILAALNKKKNVYYSDKYIVWHQVPDIQDVPVDKIKSYAYGYGALCGKTISHYSKFWGTYYFIRTFIGNYFIAFFLKNEEAAIRRIRAKEVRNGLISWKRNYTK